MVEMTDQDRIDELLRRILKAIRPDQRGGVERIPTSLQAALVLEMALRPRGSEKRKCADV